MLKVITRTAYTIIALFAGIAVAFSYAPKGDLTIKSNPEIVFQSKK